jgi:hypothetical protein
VSPLAVIVGAAGIGTEVTTVEAELPDVHPLISMTATWKLPELVSVIDCVVCPEDHTLSVAEEEVSVTLPPAQNVVGPLAVIVGVGIVAFTVTVCAAEAPEEQPPVITCTV